MTDHLIACREERDAARAEAEKLRAELAAVMQLAVDKWLDNEEGNPATRAARAREVALNAIEAAETELAAVRSERDAYRDELRHRRQSLEPDGLHRYGIRWSGPEKPVLELADDGYWTPWHVADAQLAAVRRQRDELARAALELAAAADQVCPTFDARGSASTRWARALAPLIQGVRILAEQPAPAPAQQPKPEVAP